MSEAKQDNWVTLQEEVITFVNERNGSAFPRPSESNVAILAGTFDNSYPAEDGSLLSSKVALKSLLTDRDVLTHLELNINGHQWHYILTMDKSDYVTPTTEVPPVIVKVEDNDGADDVDLDLIAGSEEVVIEATPTTEELQKVVDDFIEEKTVEKAVDADITDPGVDKIELTHEGIQGMTNEEVVAYVLQETNIDLSEFTERGKLMQRADDLLDAVVEANEAKEEK